MTRGSVLFDDAFVDTSDPFDLDEADFDGQRPADVLNSLIGIFQPYNWFIVYNPDIDGGSLFYGAVDSGIGDSTLRFSNVESDIDGTTTFRCGSVEMERQGEDIYSGVHVRYRGGSIMRRLSSTEINYSDRHANLSSDRVGRLATAQSWGDQFLLSHATPRETLTWTAELPIDKVNLVREGQRVSVRFSHVPGWEAFDWIVIRRRTVAQKADDRQMYVVRYEGSVSALEGVPGGGPPGGFPGESPCDVGAVASSSPPGRRWSPAGPGRARSTSWEFADPPTAGNLLIAAAT